ncbi:RNA polymerase sigma-70 factor (ECF subfamily) [Archangium gephyra]|uniref:DNA-binding regulatory protein n=1 Tax=Archangium gephyra TaxID=48 RepID=A0AAC8THQ7_9BACT|nr:sigma-70 family RNA polymerase sigma factor [Archangium gephyra]AKJ06120.1 putative DNA-binding regulatory protein [Archangium gephyra]REG27126.1 RNA polymerase sigma-70 factor (ECF subfamily) [Archangium gephyra]
MTSEHTESFLSRAPHALVPALRAHPGLEEALAGLVRAAREAWPEVGMDEGAFLAHVAERLPSTGEAREVLASLRTEDFFLAFACVRGEARALEAFEARVLSQVGTWLPREAPALVDELRQLLRQRLLVSMDGAPPKLASYSGRGPLGQWVRAVALRLHIDRQRAAPRERSLEEAPAALADRLGTDPELAFMRERHQEDFRVAFRAALGRLETRERNLLRLHHVHGQSMDEVSATYQAPRSTVARWIARARERLLTLTREELMARLRLTPDELDSMLRLVRSQLDVSLRLLLAD